jgi:hypothetical protein
VEETTVPSQFDWVAVFEERTDTVKIGDHQRWEATMTTRYEYKAIKAPTCSCGALGDISR